MPEAFETIATRQRSETLFEVVPPLAAGACVTTPVRLSAGFSAIGIFGVSNQPFTVTVEEACAEAGPFAATHTFASVLDPVTGLQVVCERVAPCAGHMRLVVCNVGGATATLLDLCGIGIPKAAAGEAGGAGSQGPQGPGGGGGGNQGPQGPQGGGGQGPQGPQSWQGPQGSGAQGAQSFQGPQGPQSWQGPQGEGMQGPQSFQGPQGPQSWQGPQGAGNQGPQGEGMQGPQSFQGPQGPQSWQGPQGEGMQGPQSFQGPQGPQSWQGPQGEGMQGPQSFQGPQGPQSWQGPQGEGMQGPQSFQGPQGPQSWQGPQSFQGPQGPQSWQGPQSFQGPQGPQSWQGPQSFQGPQGPQSWQGAQSFQGPQGPQSWQGAQSFQGPQGPQSGGGGTAETSEQIIWEEDESGTSNPTYSNQVLTFELRNNEDDGVVSSPLVPRNMDLTVNPTITIPFVITVLGGASANVRMQLTMRYIAVGELTTKVADETLLQTVAVINTLNEMHSMTFTLNAALMAAGDVMNFHLQRLGADAADTFTGRIGINARSARLDFTR